MYFAAESIGELDMVGARTLWSPIEESQWSYRQFPTGSDLVPGNSEGDTGESAVSGDDERDNVGLFDGEFKLLGCVFRKAFSHKNGMEMGSGWSMLLLFRCYTIESQICIAKRLSRSILSQIRGRMLAVLSLH